MTLDFSDEWEPTLYFGLFIKKTARKWKIDFFLSPPCISQRLFYCFLKINTSMFHEYYVSKTVFKVAIILKPFKFPVVDPGFTKGTTVQCQRRCTKFLFTIFIAENFFVMKGICPMRHVSLAPHFLGSLSTLFTKQLMF